VEKTLGVAPVLATWHNTRVRHCDRTRTLACQIYEASSFSRYKKG